MAIFQIFKKQLLRIVHTLLGFFFLLSPLVLMWPFPLVIPIVLMTCTSMGCHVLHKICFLYFMFDSQCMKNNPWSLFKSEPLVSSNF